MRLPRRHLRLFAPAGSLVLALGLVPVAATGSTATPPTWPVPSGAGVASGEEFQTSDREPGPVVAPRPASGAESRTGATARREPVDTGHASWPLAKGVGYRRWLRTDERGPQQVHVVTLDTDRARLRLDQVHAPTVQGRDTVGRMAKRQGAVVAVNGDFFDIADTGAALGVGATRRDPTRQARATGWNSAFHLSKGRYRVGTLGMKARIVNRPNFVFSGVNMAEIEKNGLALYTPEWGTTSGRRVLPAGARKKREVLVRRGRVVANRRRLSHGTPVRGQLLVGTGTSADLLKKLRVGKRVKVRAHLSGRPRVAIGGDRPLLTAGTRVVVDDRVLHPRTAVGVDATNRYVYLVVVDGRSTASRGATMVELADLMTELGATDALNLDGGGSSTMVTPNRKGRLSVRNTPSDGVQRPVPNGLGLFRPKRR